MEISSSFFKKKDKKTGKSCRHFKKNATNRAEDLLEQEQWRADIRGNFFIEHKANRLGDHLSKNEDEAKGHTDREQPARIEPKEA